MCYALVFSVWIAFVGDPRAQSDLTQTEPLAEYAEVISGGFTGGNRAFIRVGDQVFFDERRCGPQLAGLYVVAINEGKVLMQRHYNTFTATGASEGLFRDIDSLPEGALVIVAAKDEPTRWFDERGQQALRRIGAQAGLLGRRARTSYLCIGSKGSAPGEAYECGGSDEQRFRGPRASQPVRLIPLEEPARPEISREPGPHDLRWEIDVLYYIPRNFDPDTAEYIFCIHGAGDWHRIGAEANIGHWRHTADRHNLVVIAPAFDCLLNWPFVRERDYRNNKFANPKIMKDWHYHDFVALLNCHSDKRSDLKLLEIFDLFNDQLMRRDSFHLYGHSGGGQFANRFVTFYPERVDKVAISAAGSFAFPERTRDYPWGLRTENLEKFFGEQINPRGIRWSNREREAKLSALLDKQVFVIVGAEDVTAANTEYAWQGANTFERAGNYVEAMRREHQRQIQTGSRPAEDPFRFELHVLPGVGHDSGAGATKAMELMFPEEAGY